jgi:hypothetical protein
MTWTRTTIAAVVVGGAVVLGGGVSTAYVLGSSNHSTPVATSTATPTPSKTVAPAAPAAPAKTAAPAAPASQAPDPAASAPAASGPTIIINNNPPPPTSAVYVPVPAYAPAYVTDNEAVVQQYYAYLNSQDFQAAWAMGGSNVSGGVGYDAWVAGYSGTARINLSTWSYYPDSNAVGVTITALQDGGTTNVYQGTYTVINGVIVGANIQQTG